MTANPLSMAPTAKLAFVAHRMLSCEELCVMPIVERRVLVGVVTRSDLLRPRPPRRGVLDRALDWVQGRATMTSGWSASPIRTGAVRPRRTTRPSPG